MSRQLFKIVPPFLTLSREEQMKIIRKVRHNKYVARPALAKHKKKASAPKKKKQNKQITDLLKGLSPEQIAEIIGSMK